MKLTLNLYKLVFTKAFYCFNWQTYFTSFYDILIDLVFNKVDNTFVFIFNPEIWTTITGGTKKTFFLYTSYLPYISSIYKTTKVKLMNILLLN